jgi:solute carrier family 25 citrate transporter 1
MSGLHDTSIPISVTSPPMKHHRHRNPNISPGISLLAGATAGAIEAAITVSLQQSTFSCLIYLHWSPQYPFEFAKTLSQLKHNAYHATTITIKSPFFSLLQTVRQNGIRVVYTGCSTLVIVCISPALIPVLE